MSQVNQVMFPDILRGGNQTTIDKFPFATDGNAADVGDIGQSVGRAAGQSSAENGYVTVYMGNCRGLSCATYICKPYRKISFCS